MWRGAEERTSVECRRPRRGYTRLPDLQHSLFTAADKTLLWFKICFRAPVLPCLQDVVVIVAANDGVRFVLPALQMRCISSLTLVSVSTQAVGQENATLVKVGLMSLYDK